MNNCFHMCTLSLSAWLILSGIACQDDDMVDRFEGATELVSPIPLSRHLVFFQEEEHLAYVLKVDSDNPAPRSVKAKLPTYPIWAEQRKGSNTDELLVLCRGQQETQEQDRIPPSLVVIDAKGLDRIYELSAQFNGLIQSEDGQYAFLYFDQKSAKPGENESFISFTNQVAFIDLNRKAKTGINPVIPDLNSDDDSVPEGVVFSSEIPIGDKTYRLAVVLFDGQIAILDLDHLDSRRATSIPLGDISPDQVLFGENEAKLYIRGSNTSEIYAVLLAPNPINPGGNHFTASLNILGAGYPSSNMVLYRIEGETRILSVSGSNRYAVVLDAKSGKRYEIPLAIDVNRIMMYKASAPFDDDIEKRALLYQQASNELRSAIAFLDIEGVEERLERNLETVELNRSYNQVSLLNNNLVLLTDNSRNLSLLNLAQRTVSPAVTPVLQQLVPDISTNKLWLTSYSTQKIGYLDLETLKPGEVRLDAVISRILPISSGKNKRIAVIHPGETGYITLLDAKNPSRKTAISLQGFLISNILN